jgi:hypothetical protein
MTDGWRKVILFTGDNDTCSWQHTQDPKRFILEMPAVTKKTSSTYYADNFQLTGVLDSWIHSLVFNLLEYRIARYTIISIIKKDSMMRTTRRLIIRDVGRRTWSVGGRSAVAYRYLRVYGTGRGVQ